MDPQQKVIGVAMVCIAVVSMVACIWANMIMRRYHDDYNA